jgi:hypothetical protein
MISALTFPTVSDDIIAVMCCESFQILDFFRADVKQESRTSAKDFPSTGAAAGAFIRVRVLWGHNQRHRGLPLIRGRSSVSFRRLLGSHEKIQLPGHVSPMCRDAEVLAEKSRVVRM